MNASAASACVLVCGPVLLAANFSPTGTRCCARLAFFLILVRSYRCVCSQAGTLRTRRTKWSCLACPMSTALATERIQPTQLALASNHSFFVGGLNSMR